MKTPVFSEIRKTRASSSRKEAMARFQSVLFLGDPLCLSLSKGSLTFLFFYRTFADSSRWFSKLTPM